MKRRFGLLLVLIVFYAVIGCEKRQSDILFDRKYTEEIIAARKDAVFYLGLNMIPGATFAIAKDGKVIYSEGMGMASLDLEVPVTRSTKFRVGEISELFSSFIYLKLAEDHLLHPDTTVQFYYPDFPEKQFRLSLHHLVNHTTGIRQPSSEESDWRGLNVTLQAGIENFRNDSLMFQPGAYQIPSIFNYNLLGAVMEKVTGENYQNLLSKYITEAMGLENTIADNPLITIKGRTNFFDHNFVAQVVPAPFRDLRYRIPSEGILSNAEDMVKFGNALLLSGYFSEKTNQKLFEPLILADGFPAQMIHGWMLINDHEGRRIFGKSGIVTGGSGAMLVFPEEKLIVACAINLSLVSEEFPVFTIARHFLKNHEPGKE